MGKIKTEVNMLRFAAMLLLLSFSTYAANYDQATCGRYMESTTEALKITKTMNSSNVLVVRAAQDPSTCQFKTTGRSFHIYWEMGTKIRSGMTPCEDPTLKEIREFVGYNSLSDMYQRAVLKKSSNEIVLSMPAISDLITKVDRKADFGDELTLRPIKTANGCSVQASFVINHQTVRLTRIHAIIKFLSLRQIELYQHNSRVQSF